MSEQREQRVFDALEQGRRGPPKFTAPRIDMSHGAGGKATHKLIEGLLLPALNNPALAPLSDAALLPFGDARLAMTTDSFVVRPLVFPGGSIGELAVNGTVNDLAVSGATPIGLSAALIVEEGLETDVLAHEVEAIAAAAEQAGVPIATGDTKVVERGKGDGLYIITTGVGLADPELSLSPTSVRPGDKILCSGTLGDHGAAILIARGDLELEADVLSDTRPLTPPRDLGFASCAIPPAAGSERF
jgi:hydrogenase expression/formation protein HypE